MVRVLPAKIVYNQLLKKMKDHKSFIKFFSKQDPEMFSLLQEKFLLYSLKNNAVKVPQFKKFISSKNVHVASISSTKGFVKHFPETNKQNYIYKAKKLEDLTQGRDLKKVSLVVKSSGHSGKQSYWLKSHNQDLFLHSTMGMGLDMNFKIYSKKTLVINGFILGSWVAGINFGEYASWNCPSINIGPDKEEILQTLLDLESQFDQFIISGYPPFLKELVDFAKSKKFSFKRSSVHFFPGEEAFPESWRDYMQTEVKGAKIISGFGASDIGLVGGMESSDSIFIRRKSLENKELHKALFGDVEETPMLFQYPLSNHICVNKNNELIFSTILPETTEPVMKYNIKDQGGVLSYSKMKEILSKFGINKEIKVPLPFFYYTGRSSGAVNYNGFFIYPENIKDTIYQNKEIASSVTGKFHFHSGYTSKNNKQLVIEFQLKKSKRPNPRILSSFTKLIIKTLREVNGGYRATHIKFGKLAEPKIILHSFDKFPQKKSIKNHYS